MIFFISVALFVQGKGLSDEISTLFSVASFLFGIFLGFSISNSHGRFNQICQILRTNDAIILFIYQMSGQFGEKIKKDIQILLDNYLIDQLDYYLFDFKKSHQSFMKLFQYLDKLVIKNEKQKKSYESMVDSLSDSLKNRKTVEALLQQPMFKFEWISILTLLAIILFCIFYINTGSVLSIISSVLLSTSAIILVFVLKDLDNLSWKEQQWIWEPIEDLFCELGLLPYYPIDVLKSKRAKVKKGEKIRVAIYPNPYPDMTRKKIEILEV